MKRKTYLFPLMAVTALSLSLAACDDKKDETAATDNAAVEAPAATTETAAPTPAPETPAPAAAPVKAEGATAYASPEGVTNGAAFVTLTASEADKLVGASTDVAASVEIHQNVVDAATGTVSMHKVDGIDLQPGQSFVLKNDTYHLMLIGLKAPLTAGQTFNITLDFEKGADVVVPVTVVEAGAAVPAADAGMSHDHAADAPEEEDVAPAPETTGTAPATEEAAPAPAPAEEEGTQAPAAQ